MPRFYLGQGDTSPSKQDYLEDENGDAVDLTGATVTFKMVDEDGNTLVESEGDVVTPSEGEVKYEWDDGDSDTAGEHEARWLVDYNGDGDTDESFPNSATIIVVISDEL